MADKKYTQVTIAGRTYLLGGYEDEEYLQKIAGHINQKMETMRRVPGYSRLTPDYQTVMLELNLVDDYFQQKAACELMEARMEEMEKEIYDLKHDLVLQQIQREKEKKGEF